MKDKNLRDAVMVVSASYRTRGDHDGDLISNVLKIILSTVEALDEAEEIGTGGTIADHDD
jgi:hypothetical protein